MKDKRKIIEEVLKLIDKDIKKYEKEDWRSISFGMKELKQKIKEIK